MSKPDWLTVGHIAGTHGVRGEVRVVSRTDYPELRFVPDARLILEHPRLKENLSLTVESVRSHQKGYLIRFREWPDLTTAEPYKGGTLLVNRSEGVEGEEDGFYLYEIMGCEVVTTEGESLGTITNILQPGANDVWVVRRPKGKELLIPFIEDVVKEVDVAAKRVTIQWMEGLD
ncbi:ribosome maturation factor RimM [Marininema halotolerans]|uniref:Ribosome maturation factor RimM n=1 Tax=Marininema halotolerans TaxID=1155944 RepID=A0A1I6QHL2_9BACL|nr:ribosome maturation factor RimM [Marininema halotolerans]SFS51959.1 16S rRNA processing protein RimM [Marininema halotolerans]